MSLNFSMIFNNYCGILASHKKDLQTLQFDIDNLNEIRKSLRFTPEFITYTFTNIRIVVPKRSRPNHCIPSQIEAIEVILSIKDDIIIKKTKPNYIEDPLVKLATLNIILNSDKYTSSWHLDRHEKEENEGSPKSLHPLYHLTFGGHHMETKVEEDGSDIFGRALIVRAPRIMHPPMELILGLDFIFNHFIPKNDLSLLSDGAYISIIKELKQYFWLPFSLALAKNYCTNIDIDSNRFQFDDIFVSSLLSC